MAINIKFDSAGNPEPPTIILANRNGNKLGQLKVDAKSIDLSDKFNDASEISFIVNKYIDDEIVPLWDKIVDFKLIYCKEWDVWFEIEVELDEETESVKTVLGTQLGYAELSQVMLYNIEINTEKDIERDDYKITILYDPEDSQASLLDRIFEKAPHYSVIHVDPTIANIQRSFSFDDTSIVDACQDIAEEIGCLFEFHSNSDDKGMPQRTVSVYDLYQNCNNCKHRGEFTDKCPECESENIEYNYGEYTGEDTTIFVTSDELATNGIEFTTDTSAVKNCFKLEAGDDLMTATVRNCNPNGTDYIWYFSDSLKEDMSDELVKKLNSYDALYKQYYNTHVSRLNTTLVSGYNSLVTKYSGYNKDLQTIPFSITGYPALMNAYYNAVDLGWYLKSGLMPPVDISDVLATNQANLLSGLLSSVAVANAAITSPATADSAVLGMARTFIKKAYKIQIKSSEYNEVTRIWNGIFTITNYSDEGDSADTLPISVEINDKLKSFIEQKIDKALNKVDTDDVSITGLFKKDIIDFKFELKRYALVPLNSFHDACQSCIDILIEQGAANITSDLYKDLYLPYYTKLIAIQSEIKLRESELNTVIGVHGLNDRIIKNGLQQEIEKHRDAIQKALNFQNYMGETLWLEFCAYRRESKYSNSNYISDGLNNAELFNRASEFYKAAENEIYKSAELQHSISTTLNNLLAIEKFKPLVKYFNVGNWLRVRVDDNIYKLRLLEYEIDFGNFDVIPVEFSDVTKIKNGITDVESVLSQASSMASSYDAVMRQSNKGNEARSTIREWLTEGLNTALVQIQNNTNEDIVIDNNGLLGRSYSDITEDYSPKQIKLTHNIIAYTDNNWETVKQAIGEHKYKMYDAGKKDFVDKVGYGMSAEFVTAGIVSGSQIIGGNIYSENYSSSEGSYINLLNGDFSFGGGALRFEIDEETNKRKLTINSPDIPTTEQITEINEEYLKTTTVYAKNLQVSAAKIQDKLTATQINTDGLIAENISATTLEGKTIKGGTLLIGNKSGSSYAEITSGGVLTCKGANITGNIKGGTLLIGSKTGSSYAEITSGGVLNCKGANINGGTLLIGDKSGSSYAEITSDGVLTCKGADISGYIDADFGRIGSWYVSSYSEDDYYLHSSYTHTDKSIYEASLHSPGFVKSTPRYVYSITKDDVLLFYVDTNGKIYTSNSYNGYLEIDNSDDVRMRFGLIDWEFASDPSSVPRDTILSDGGLVISANSGINSLYLNAKGLYFKGTDIKYTGAIGINADGKVINVDTSSQRYKENITEDYDERLNPENLYKIPVKQFNYKDEYKDVTFNPDTQIGLIAEDVDKYFPSACYYNEQGQTEGWHDRLIVPAMLKLIQNQKSSIDDLTQKYQALAEELNAVKSKPNK